jgi:hypothetical protein
MAFKAAARQQRNDRRVGRLATLLDGFLDDFLIGLLDGLLGKESTRDESTQKESNR